MTYKVFITETLKMLVTVEADSPTEAEEIVSDDWKNGEHILDAENFSNVSFIAEEVES